MPYRTTSIASFASSGETAVDSPCNTTTPMMAALSTASVTQPKPARTSDAAPPLPNPSAMASEMDNFFGPRPAETVRKPKPAAPKRSSREQPGLPAHGRACSQGTLAPAQSDIPAHLAPTPKPKTMARYLFLYGFLFPPFWAIGACILRSPLTADAHPTLPKDVEAGPCSVAYQRAELSLSRKTELVYARRCLVAFITFLALVVIVIVATRVAHVGAFARN